MRIDLSNKVAIVTGASRGIGRAIALALAAAGANVVVNYRGQQAAAEEVVAAIGAAGGQALAVQGDVAQAVDVERLVKTTLDAWGRVDILVNNAGITRDNLLLRMKDEEWDAVFATNLRGAYLLTKAVLRPMMKARWGRIINIASVVGLTGNAGQANYAAAKAGLIGFTKTVAREMASRGITANVVAPGYVETDITGGLSDEIKAAALRSIPLERFGRPADVAPAVVFLASDAAGYITGQTLAVDGGMTMC
ncbi:3-oxoacyl-[acyl-carrier-protein] reductase [Kallotenue papyrolyticum]|uniref:3-oxoacyl-[acyl-carrier-protein] reductase n=1 Tax=Kallotenue papyrolyticum TaxID=1325125 RepID=UPI0004B677AE|nr:3-oxoacyl-[acyl-carrier-protein] reductase [Kallotenue papyrolyticum]